MAFPFPEKVIYNDAHRAAAANITDGAMADMDTLLGAVIDHSALVDHDKVELMKDVDRVQQHLITLQNHLGAVIRPTAEEPPLEP